MAEIKWNEIKSISGPVSEDGRFRLVWDIAQEGQPTLYTVYDGEKVLAEKIALLEGKELCQSRISPPA